VFGIGGATNGKDVIEFMMAGASAVAIGSGTLRDPYASVKAIGEIEKFMKAYNIKDINSIIGTVQFNV